MPFKTTKAVDGTKISSVTSSYVTGAPVGVAAGHVAIYVDVTTNQEYRGVEIDSRIQELASRAREQNYGRPAAVATYYSMPVAGGKGQITKGDVSVVVDGVIAIGIGADVQSANVGSGRMDACITQLAEYAKENA